MSPTSALPPLSHLQWRAPEWITAFGPLTKSILMDYFVLSPFFDHGSNNATLRMQIMFSRQGGAGAAGNAAGGLMDGLDEEGELKRFKGIEYVVVHDDAPGLFIIHKRDRQSPTQGTSAYLARTSIPYHILNDSIYEAPSLYQVVNERLLASLHALSTSLNALKANQPNWSTERGAGQWKIRSTATTLTDPSFSSATDLNPLDVLGAQATKKRSREDEASSPDEPEPVIRAETGEGVQDLSKRPPETFNPLLFNALDRVARELPVPIRLDESIPPPPNGSLGEAEAGKKEDGGTTSGEASGGVPQRTKASSTTAPGTGTKSGKQKITQGPNGKRIPRKALQAQASAGA
ncbi:BZ3500_MvSof-1268-A1-R1_Chr4-2g07165 [Microbotryum saponariae]|uniref:Mediator of RNA polymerase II transcription subunit 6 n=1 Tax=Microbotryum saponariae TaxID=289078 RepID=A0A2X0LNA1_9BASI|nr:BZ3500_MvSof-1268-A1-R1_Chr4-2g07165 [Microbotryum saponariae]SDA06830.1 BZ3501_MvSof-1269-A2-R1_Chr4-2g06876 [Microbotryum saponariae]